MPEITRLYYLSFSFFYSRSALFLEKKEALVSEERTRGRVGGEGCSLDICTRWFFVKVSQFRFQFSDSNEEF